MECEILPKVTAIAGASWMPWVFVGTCAADVDGDGLCDSEDLCSTPMPATTQMPKPPNAILFVCGKPHLPLACCWKSMPTACLTEWSYRLYVTRRNDRRLVWLMGKDGQALEISTTTTFLQDASSELDSYLTLDGASVSTLGTEDAWSAFESGTNLIFNTPVGGGWMAADAQAAEAGEDLRVLVAQLTTDGDISVDLTAQIMDAGLPSGRMGV